ERGGSRSIMAAREVIVSAGYLYTPRLLFLSGIGDAGDLARAGLEVVRDMPAVGKNLTAPRMTPLSWRTNTPTISQMMGPPISKEGPADREAFSSVIAEATVPVGEQAIAQFMPLYYAPKSAPLQFSLQGEPWPLETNAYTIAIMVTMATAARGSIAVDPDPDVSPTITHDPLTPEDVDAARGAAAVRAAEQLGARLASTGRVEHAQDWSAVYDGRGTCRMGTDPRTSVVDPTLRVHGIRGLRIVDGSVLPSSTPYLAMPEVLMLAERAADLILDVPTYAASDLEPGESLARAVGAARGQLELGAEGAGPAVRHAELLAASAAPFALCAALGAGAVLLSRRRAHGATGVGDFYVQA
ncbi:unnamed protein product, partial [Prorocentrum cordatum]